MISNKINKKDNFNQNLKKILIVLWIIFSVFFILWDLWSDFKNYQISSIIISCDKKIEEGKKSGFAAAVNQIMEKTNNNCSPFPVFSGEKTIELINYACLQSSVQSEEKENKN